MYTHTQSTLGESWCEEGSNYVKLICDHNANAVFTSAHIKRKIISGHAELRDVLECESRRGDGQSTARLHVCQAFI